MSENITTRQVEDADQPFLLDLFADTANEGLQLPRALIEMQFRAKEMAYRQFEESEDRVILRDGERVGRIIVHESADELRLVDIAVRPNEQGQGVGSHLFVQLRQRSNATGKPLRLHVSTRNSAAERFYKRHGCSAVGRDEAYIAMEYVPSLGDMSLD